MSEKIDKDLAYNIVDRIENGPGLKSTTRTNIACRGNGKVLVVGLGGMGVGQMVFSDESYRDKPEFNDIPEVDDPKNYYYDMLFGRGLMRIPGK